MKKDSLDKALNAISNKKNALKTIIQELIKEQNTRIRK